MLSLDVTNMSFSYGSTVIFENTSMTVAPSKVTGILGGNGSGKTTLFDLICELHLPTSGTIQCTSKNLLYLSQILNIPAVLTMRDIAKMTIALAAFKTAKFDDILNKISDWGAATLERYSRLLKKKASLCSYGEKRWFFTLTLLALEPDILILDEPTAGVDPENRYYIWNALRSAASKGTAVIVSSHDTSEIAQYCHQFYMISQFKLVRFESGEEYMKSYNAQSLDQAFIRAVRK
ncbi:ATP-binding cassette domain-containing protein [Pseudomonas abietaniphila]|uniref:ABC-2 type transport system ATP-binding protein n=1 Tax=Pseudomonas abietaniphila TaxID=89065 RepID=A0A1G7VTQ9_9PSED|nr:ABC transporter ATP-binding protein [Pseudomonas abietaniphila]SDG62290.1 ABC-2 type transport system ATP-binding protein [Pseudomonas abietaniphila]